MEREMEVVEVHDGRVSKEAMLTIKQLLLELKISWSKINFMELDSRSILITLELLAHLYLKAAFFPPLQHSLVGG